jgi:hypothetical protein
LLAVVVALGAMRPAHPASVRRGNVVAAIVEGLRYLVVQPVLCWIVLMLVVTSLTVRPYNFLFRRMRCTSCTPTRAGLDG